MVDQKWLEFLREQFPVGSRIKLREMKDPYSPVKPGSEGTLTHIDDIGTFHVDWDDGRSLGAVLGEDSFSVLPPEPELLKLYMPMSVTYYERNSWGNLEDEDVTLGEQEAVRYTDVIAGALRREEHPEEAARGLMKYYHKDDSVNRKVRSYRFTAEARNGKLWGVAECMVLGQLTPDELETLKETVAGQASDGLGEGFEQHGIDVGGRELYAHLWQGSGWSIQTEQERFAPKLASSLPELCFSVLHTTGQLICIKRGESGYYPSDWSTDDKERNIELADFNNEKLGVTPEQRQAMEVGSMVGWDVPGAAPANYGGREHQMGGMSLG